MAESSRNGYTHVVPRCATIIPSRSIGFHEREIARAHLVQSVAEFAGYLLDQSRLAERAWTCNEVQEPAQFGNLHEFKRGKFIYEST